MRVAKNLKRVANCWNGGCFEIFWPNRQKITVILPSKRVARFLKAIARVANKKRLRTPVLSDIHITLHFCRSCSGKAKRSERGDWIGEDDENPKRENAKKARKRRSQMKMSNILIFLILLNQSRKINDHNACRFIGSRIIDSTAYCNLKLMAPLCINSTQNMSFNWIIRLLISLLCRPKVILISGGHCILIISFLTVFTIKNQIRKTFENWKKNDE
jgi:hypothetical protein